LHITALDLGRHRLSPKWVSSGLTELKATAGQDGYDVRHVLLREVVDADLLPGERMDLHAGYAHALSQRPALANEPPAVLAAELAVHWDAAGEPTRALPARVDAGRAAEQAHAFPEALRHYEPALELWGQVPEPDSLAQLDRVELLTRAADVATACARADQALVLLTEALDRLASAADPVRTALLHMRLGGARWDVGDEPGCLAALDQAVRILPAEPSVDRARILTHHAQWLMATWRYRDAIGRSEQALAVARTVGARAEEGLAVDILGRCTADAARVVEARQIAEEAGNAGGIVQADLSLGSVLWETGRLREALAAWQGGIAVAREFGRERLMGHLTANLAGVLLELGAWEDIDRVVSEGLKRERRAASELHTIKGMLAVWRGDLQAAREHLELARRLQPPLSQAAWPFAGLAELAIWEGRYDDAGAVVDQAVAALGRAHRGDLPPDDTAEVYALGLQVQRPRRERRRTLFPHHDSSDDDTKHKGEDQAQHPPDSPSSTRRLADGTIAGLNRHASIMAGGDTLEENSRRLARTNSGFARAQNSPAAVRLPPLANKASGHRGRASPSG
jgi:tetratricopeptide (TPR) repeat protein